VSYSFLEPDWPAYCECRYDETRDEMDREDCPFHCGLVDDAAKEQAKIPRRKASLRNGDLQEPAA